MCKKAFQLSQMQDAFNPGPLESQEDLNDFYMDTSFARTGDYYSDFVKNLLLQLEDCREVYLHKLFIGHPGCGKTTELFQLLRKTKEQKFFSCMGRCDLELDSADVEYTDVLFLILDLLVREAVNHDIKIDEKMIEGIYEYWQEEMEIVDSTTKQVDTTMENEFQGSVGIAQLLNVMAKIKGVIKNSSNSRIEIRRRIEPKSSELISKIQDVITVISEQCVKKGMHEIPLIILDGLDKIPLEQARKIFRENGSRFNSLNIHLIVTFPIALTYTSEYSDVLTWFPNPEKLPMIKLRKWEDERYVDGYEAGINTMTEIVEKRANLELFEEGVLANLIQMTGGYIRDLFRCISRATVRARLRGADAIAMEDAEIALNNLESDINGRYGDEMIPIMKKIYDGEKFVSSSDDMTELLQVGAVLEYNGQRWCDLHPLVEKWLRNHNRI